MINDMGISVYETPPDGDELVLSDDSRVGSDDDATEEAVAVLASSVDAEFGRTTDPVRMYMREMGTVELLTRQGEIEIAKRIEEGQREVMLAIAAFPPTLQTLFGEYQRTEDGEIRLHDVVVGFNEPIEDDSIPENESEPPITASKSKNDNSDDEDEDEDEDEDITEETNDNSIDPEEVRARINALKELADRRDKGEDVQEELANRLAELKLNPNLNERLVEQVKATVNRIRQLERQILNAAVNRGGMERAQFINEFPGNETSSEWLNKAEKALGERMAAERPEIERLQKRLSNIERDCGLCIQDIKKVNREVTLGEAKARRAKKR